MALKNGMRPVHPGEVLRKDFMRPAGLSAKRLG
jgi:plasmid maintenance system antidote protein VapI